MKEHGARLLGMFLLVVLTGCSSAPYSVYSSRDGETWGSPLEKLTKEQAALRVKSSCRLVLWGPYRHSVRVVNEATQEETTIVCETYHAELEAQEEGLVGF